MVCPCDGFHSISPSMIFDVLHCQAAKCKRGCDFHFFVGVEGMVDVNQPAPAPLSFPHFIHFYAHPCGAFIYLRSCHLSLNICEWLAGRGFGREIICSQLFFTHFEGSSSCITSDFPSRLVTGKEEIFATRAISHQYTNWYYLLLYRMHT